MRRQPILPTTGQPIGEVCRVCHRDPRTGVLRNTGVGGLPCASCRISNPDPEHPDLVELWHGEHWCSTLCRRLDTLAAGRLDEYDQALDSDMTAVELAQCRYRLRKAFLMLDERARPDEAKGEREAFMDDIESGYIVPPHPIPRKTLRGTQAWRDKIREARKTRSG